MQPPGESKRAYFAVIVLFGLAFAALPSISVAYFEVQALTGCVIVCSNYQAVTEVAETAYFFMYPCLFFAALYIYGKKTMRHFSGGYLGATLSLLLGSCIGAIIFYLSSPIIYGAPVSLGTFYSFSVAFGIVSAGVQRAFIGIAALALSHLRAKPPAAPPEGHPESTIL